MARYNCCTSTSGRPSMDATSSSHDSTASLLLGANARLATSANRSRSNGTLNSRPPAAFPMAFSIHRRRHRPSSGRGSPSSLARRKLTASLVARIAFVQTWA